MRLLHAGLSDAGRRRAGTRARHQRRRSARRALVQSLPLHRLPEHHQGGVRAAEAAKRDARGNDRRRRNSSAAPSRGSRIGRCSPARAASPPTFRSPANGTCAWCARRSRTAKSNRSTRAPRSRCRACTRCGRMPTSRTFRRSRFRLTGLEDLEPYRQPVLAKDVVRYVGEPVAVVFADDAYLAEDAAELVELAIEHLPAIAARDRATGRLRARPADRAGRPAKRLWRRRRRLPQRPRHCCA